MYKRKYKKLVYQLILLSLTQIIPLSQDERDDQYNWTQFACMGFITIIQIIHVLCQHFVRNILWICQRRITFVEEHARCSVCQFIFSLGSFCSLMNLLRRIHLLDSLTYYVDFMDGLLESSHFLYTMRFESQQIPCPQFIVKTF